jgi:hypothetical protein
MRSGARSGRGADRSRPFAPVQFNGVAGLHSRGWTGELALIRSVHAQRMGMFIQLASFKRGRDQDSDLTPLTRRPSGRDSPNTRTASTRSGVTIDTSASSALSATPAA